MKKSFFIVLILAKVSLVFGEDLSSCTLKKTPDDLTRWAIRNGIIVKPLLQEVQHFVTC